MRKEVWLPTEFTETQTDIQCTKDQQIAQLHEQIRQMSSTHSENSAVISFDSTVAQAVNDSATSMSAILDDNDDRRPFVVSAVDHVAADIVDDSAIASTSGSLPGNNGRPLLNNIVIVSLGITEEKDIFRDQVYFGKPGELLQPVHDVEGTLIKFGNSRRVTNRCNTHNRQFDGFELLESVITLFPEVVETRLKAMLRMQNRLIKCKSPHKKFNDTEIVAIKSQEEYEALVLLTKNIADDYAIEVGTKLR